MILTNTLALLNECADALQELVSLKHMHDEADHLQNGMQFPDQTNRASKLIAEYNARKPAAWEAARNVLARVPTYHQQFQNVLDALLAAERSTGEKKGDDVHSAPTSVSALPTASDLQTELVEALRVFAYEIAGISEADDDVLRESANAPDLSITERQLIPALLNARALLAKAAPSEGLPGEGVVVPREPTAEMIKAGGETPKMKIINGYCTTAQLRGNFVEERLAGPLSDCAIAQCYKAMLAAAPAQRESGGIPSRANTPASVAPTPNAVAIPFPGRPDKSVRVIFLNRYASDKPLTSDEELLLALSEALSAKPEHPAWVECKERLPDRALADETGCVDGLAIELVQPTTDGGPYIRQAYFDLAIQAFVCSSTGSAIPIPQVVRWSRLA